jgi:serine/threonine protein kinase
VKILDFGLARLQGSENDAQEVATIVTRPNMVMGTPDFVAPEQARNLHAVDIRADLYSLGCTLYFLLTGEVPFPEGGALEKLIRHTTEEPIPIDKLRGDVPPAVSALVRKLMAKDPALRYQTPAELATALEPHAVEAGNWTPTTMGPLSTSEFASEEAAAGGISSEEALATPLPASEPNFVFHASASPSEETGALINTVLPDGTATLVSGTHLPGAVKNLAAQADRRRITLAIAIAVAIVGLLLGLISLL